MTKIKVKIISLHQPNEIVEMEINKANELAKIGNVEIIDDKTINNSKRNSRDTEISGSGTSQKRDKYPADNKE